MSLQEAVARAFDSEGALAKRIERFLPRQGQLLMAQAVAQTMEEGGVLVVEAGTGVGKTFAYLVPALLSGGRVLLSTATKTLQDQLFWRDLPRLAAALGLPVRTALLKGRGSYLCLHRLNGARNDDGAIQSEVQRDLERVGAWAVTTRSGDLAELTDLDERSPVLPLVTSTRENCLGASCPQLQACHVNLARREAMAADLIVINHHLFFADLNIRESGVAELLPSVNSVVFDEAHQLNEIGIQFMGRQLTTGQLDSYCQELSHHGPQLVLASADWREVIVELARCIGLLRNLGGARGTSGRMAWDNQTPPGIDPQTWQTVVSDLHAGLQQVEIILRSMEEFSPELKGLRERASQLMAALDLFSHDVDPGWVRWIETGKQTTLAQSPLDVAQALRFDIVPLEPETRSRKSWIFTSASLGHDAGMVPFLESCGLQGSRVLQVQSPFDYFLQAGVYIPSHLPKPSDIHHSAAVAALVAQGATILCGRTLVLTTTLRAMRDIAVVLRQSVALSAGVEVLVQGDSPKRELTERFIRGDVQGAKGCVLVATASFWEGIDVPGDALQMVVIDKLPFSPPDDPVVQARARQLEAMGKRPFHHLHVPQAAMALNQGAGRLIRSETDRGILVICDVRLNQMGYGRRILAALPPMRPITTHEEFIQALVVLTKPSTMDPS